MADEIRNEALEVMLAYGDRRGMKEHVAALLNSVGDTLTEEFVLDELRAIRQSGQAYKRIIATNTD